MSKWANFYLSLHETSNIIYTKVYIIFVKRVYRELLPFYKETIHLEPNVFSIRKGQNLVTLETY